MINDGLTKIKNIKNDSKYYHLFGDKGYKTNEKFNISNKLIKIITPDKINTKK